MTENAGGKAETILANMYAEVEKSSRFGVDCRDGKVKDAVEAGILDVMETKTWALKLCFDVVITILRVD